jgi:hypothetical protein
VILLSKNYPHHENTSVPDYFLFVDDWLRFRPGQQGISIADSSNL